MTSVKDRVDGLRETSEGIVSECDVTFELYHIRSTRANNDNDHDILAKAQNDQHTAEYLKTRVLPKEEKQAHKIPQAN